MPVLMDRKLLAAFFLLVAAARIWLTLPEQCPNVGSSISLASSQKFIFFSDPSLVVAGLA